jgi:hypothetical protein
MWMDASGYRSVTYARDVTLRCGDTEDDWVMELQAAVTLI